MFGFKKTKDGSRRVVSFMGIELYSYERVNYRREYYACLERYQQTKRQLDYMKKHADIFHMKPAEGELREQQLKLVDFALLFFEQIKHLNIKPMLAYGSMLGAWRHQGFIPWDDDIDFFLIRSDYEKLIKWCEENAVVCQYDGKLSQYGAYAVGERLHKRVTEHPNKWVVDIWHTQIQISRGSCPEDQLYIDFFPLDYYDDSYSYEAYLQCCAELLDKMQSIDVIEEVKKVVRDEVKNNKNVVEKSGKIFHGFDGGWYIENMRKQFIPVDVVYPLRYTRFEHAEFLVPHKTDEFLDYMYADKLSFPSDVGISSHNEMKAVYAKSK